MHLSTGSSELTSEDLWCFVSGRAQSEMHGIAQACETDNQKASSTQQIFFPEAEKSKDKDNTQFPSTKMELI